MESRRVSLFQSDCPLVCLQLLPEDSKDKQLGKTIEKLQYSQIRLDRNFLL